MSSKTPKLSGSKLIKILEKLGFEVIRIKEVIIFYSIQMNAVQQFLYIAMK